MKVEHGKGVTSLSQSHKMVTSQVTVTKYMTGSHIIGNMRTMGSEVHSYNSSCIYSVKNQMGTLLSFPC